MVGNTRDGALVKQVIGDHKLEAVIHFAAYKAAGESMTHPAKYFDNNVQGSLQLMEAACQAGVRQFVFSSTAAIYGTPSTLPWWPRGASLSLSNEPASVRRQA